MAYSARWRIGLPRRQPLRVREDNYAILGLLVMIALMISTTLFLMVVMGERLLR